jgi:hypothetical protein
VKTTEWDPAASLDTEEKMALYLEAACSLPTLISEVSAITPA